MSSQIQQIKEKLNLAITQLCKTSWMFVKNPNCDFTRERKLPSREVISILLCMEGGSLTGELLRYFGCSRYSPSSSAFIQQRQKINEFALSDSSYETVITNLDAEEYSPEELKQLYGMRWGIETSFRELKYTVGLLHFHAKKGGEHYARDLFQAYHVQLL